MSTKLTWTIQGPKRNDAFDDQTYFTIIQNGEECIGFFYPRSTMPDDLQQANAELIADAPALLAERDRLREALASLIDFVDCVGQENLIDSEVLKESYSDREER